MQVRNDYDRMVFNDIGTVGRSTPRARLHLVVHFPDRDEAGAVVYEGKDLNELTLAYCTSVHKSQGSEYPAVVMPVHWVMPGADAPQLLYTAVTRARRLVVLVGREDALKVYVRTRRPRSVTPSSRSAFVERRVIMKLPLVRPFLPAIPIEARIA